MSNRKPFDLVCLAADENMRQTLESILKRHQSLGIRAIRTQVYKHPGRDPGCYRQSPNFLRNHIDKAEHALVVLDQEGCGADQSMTREQIERDIEDRLRSNGWPDNRSAAIVIAPELETWVWSDSPHVAELLGWKPQSRELSAWLEQKGYLQPDERKPRRPKEAVEAALRFAKKPRSSSIYKQLAEVASLTGCVDPSFTKLKQTLGAWFSSPR